ncbi:MAG: SGNH/GDSL hydrolase family protein [Humibacter sp.]
MPTAGAWLGVSAAFLVLGGCALAIAASLSSDVHPHPVTADPPASTGTVVAVGDSIMDGHGLQPDQAWPAVVARYNGWHLVNLATDGAGFVTKGNDGSFFADQVREAVELDPAIVIISGSSNDLGVPESDVQESIISAMDTLRHDLPHTTIVAVSPVWNESEPPAQLDRINDDMESAVKSANGIYVSIGKPLLGMPGYLQSDDVHPTVDGQLVIASAVEEGLESAHIV